MQFVMETLFKLFCHDFLEFLESIVLTENRIRKKAHIPRSPPKPIFVCKFLKHLYRYSARKISRSRNRCKFNIIV